METGKYMLLLFSWALVDPPCWSQGKYNLSICTLNKIDFFFDSLSVTAELIGPNHESGAFMYGFMSLVAKVTNGIIIIGVQSLASGRSSGNSTFYTQVLFYVCGGASLMGALAMLSLAPVKIGRRFWKSNNLSDKEESVEIVPAIHINSASATVHL